MLRKKISAALAAIMTLASFGTAFAQNDPDVIPLYEDTLDIGNSDTETLSVAADTTETSKFSYRIDNGTLTVSLKDAAINNASDEDSDVIIAVYDGDILLCTKIYSISGEYQKVTVKDWQTDVAGVENIRVRAFMWTADGKCTPLEEASEISNVPSGAYKVYGRVTATYFGSGGSLRPDEVKFDVEVSDNFDGILDIKKPYTQDNQIFKVGSTNASDLLFIYSEAYVVKDADTGEFTLMSIRPYGDTHTVTFAANDLAADDPTIGADYIGKGKLPVYKSANTSSTTKYDLAYDAKLYVNGVEAGYATNDLIADYILANPTGTVQLVDQTEVGSTSTDGKYDKIMVTFYVDAVVDYVTVTSSHARIYFKASQISAMRMEWNPEDNDIYVKFASTDGAEVNFADLAEYDVLSIQYDMVGQGTSSSALTDADFYDVIVSKNVVEGNVTSKDWDDQTVTVNGTEYPLVYNEGAYSSKTQTMTSVSDYELGTKYKLYIDAFGYVAHFDEGVAPMDYGVIVAMYKNSGDDYPTVRLVTADGEIVAYECKDDMEARKFYNYAVSGDVNGSASYTSFTKNTYVVKTNIMAGKTVCTYKISGGRIKFDKAYHAANEGHGYDLEYRAFSSKIGPYSIDQNTRIIDMDGYMNNDGDTVSTLTTASFEDEAEYDAFFYDKNSDGVYRFAIVFKGTSSLRPESQLAIIKKANGQTEADSATCWSYTALRAGEEVEVLVDDSTTQLPEGAIIAYKLNSDGYVDNDSNSLVVLYTPDSTYKMTRANILADDDFGKVLYNVSVVTSGKNAGKYEIKINGKTSTSKDVLAYVGVVYSKTESRFELFTRKMNGISSIFDTESFAIGADTNVYTLDYATGTLTAADSPIQYNTVFNSAYINDSSAVDWENLNAQPQLAFVKEVDGKATDVIFFVPPEYSEGVEPVDEPEEEGVNYGIITAMYKESGKDYPTVRLVTMNGELVSYECKDEAEASEFYNYAVYGDAAQGNYFTAFNKNQIRNNILSGQTVCQYSLSGNKIRFANGISTNGGYDLEYNSSLCSLGSYYLNDGATKMVDMDVYMNNDTNEIGTIAVSQLEDEAEYDAYVFGRSNAGYYRYAVFFGGLYSIRPTTQIAVVKSINGQKDSDSTTCSAYTVLKGGEEVEMLYEDTYSYLSEGTVIAYLVGPDGYVEDGNLYILYTPTEYYALDMILSKDDFGKLLTQQNVKQITTYGKNYGKYEIAYNGMTSGSKDVFAYVGIVYRKSGNDLELFTKQSGGISQLADLVDISLAGANVYTFDYNERANKGVRLTVGSVSQTASVFNQAFIDDKNAVRWSNFDGATPMYAFVKEVDGDATDVVLYMAE